MFGPTMQPTTQPTKKQRPSLAWTLSLGTLGAVLLLYVLFAAVFWNRLPRPAATHWNAWGVADGTGSIWNTLLLGALVLVLTGVLMPLGSLSKANRGPRAGEPLLAGLGAFIMVALGALFIAGLAGQVEAPQALGTRLDGPVLVAGLALAAVWAAVCARLVRRAAGNREDVDAPEGSAARMGVPPADPGCLPPGTRLSSRLRGPVWLLVVLGVLVAGMLALGASVAVESAVAFLFMLPGLAIIVLAAGCLASGRVVVDDAGIRVYAGGFLKLLQVPPDMLSHASADEIGPAPYGGWGLRLSAGGVAFVVRTGPGIVVQRIAGGDRIYSVATMDDARAMAALLNQLAARNPHPGS